MKKGGTVRVKEGSGNVFADLGFPNPEREQLKAQLTLQIYRLMRARGLTQAGRVPGIQQPHVSSLVRGHSGNFFGRAADGVFDCAGAGYRDCGEAKTAASAVRS